MQIQREDELRVKRSTRRANPAGAFPETIRESDEDEDAPFASSSPPPSDGITAADADEIEATVASLAFESAADSIIPGTSNLTQWFDFGQKVPDCAVRISHDSFAVDVVKDDLAMLCSRGNLDDNTHTLLMSIHNGMRGDDLVDCGIAGMPIAQLIMDCGLIPQVRQRPMPRQ